MWRILLRFPRNPAAVYTGIRKRYGDVVRLYDFRGRPWLFFAGPEAARRIHQGNHRAYGRGRFNEPFTDFLGAGLLTSERDTWSRHRRIIGPHVRGESQQRFLADAARLVADLVARWQQRAGGRAFDICPDLELFAYRVVAYSMFGLVDDDEAGTVRSLDKALEHVSTNSFRLYELPSWLTAASRRRFRRQLARLERPVRAAITRARADARSGAPRTNLLLDLVDDRHRLTDVEIRDEILTMLHAGQHTVASGTAFALHLIATHPAVQDALVAEITGLGGRPPTADDLLTMPYLDAVVDEALRLFPPAWGGVREAIVDDVVDGVPVPAGTPVVFSQFVTHRHPDLWTAPDEFRPDRADRAGPNDYRYFPFGGGPHRCVGQDLALLEMKMVIVALLARFRLVPGGRPVRPRATLDLVPAGGVHLRVEERDGATGG
jgi:cytochrome P450